MKKIYVSILLIAFGSKFTSCNPPETQAVSEKPVFDEIKKAEWFLGRWENNSADGNLSEIWTRESNSSYTGESYFVIAGDTVFEEHIRLTEAGGKLIYSPTVADQNNGKPVSFTLTHSSGKKLVFENPKHDFPKKISYSLRNDSLVAVISGNGKEEVFVMGRK